MTVNERAKALLLEALVADDKYTIRICNRALDGEMAAIICIEAVNVMMLANERRV